MGAGEFKDLATGLGSLATTCSYIIGGIWVYQRFVRQQEKFPNIEFSCEIEFVGKQESEWIVELSATVENKGKAQHKMKEFKFDLNGIKNGESIETNIKWGGQIDFKHKLCEGSFLPESMGFFFIDPGVKAKYSFVTKVPVQTSFVIMHSWFKYVDNRNYRHTAEKTKSVPKEPGTSEVSV